MNPLKPVILCVDDEEADLRLLEKLLVPRGYVVVSAADGKEALLKIRSQAIDLVLLDIIMPGMDGFEVCRQIKEDQKFRSIPVIMVTALSAKQDRIRGIEAGAEEFLSKPFDQTEVLARIKILLKMKGLDDGRKLVEEELQRRSVELEAVNKELDAFSHSVSHDLRAPLRAIDGWSLVLLEDYGCQLDEQGRTYLSRVRTETQRMGALVDDLLQLSRMSRTEMCRQPVDMSGIARTLAARLRETAPERTVEFIIQPDLIAQGDAPLLEVALENLLSNAFKFTSNCTQARIEFGRTDGSGTDAFFIRDNGAGFDMAYANKLFGAFQRMHKTSDFPGTGIGLTIVQRIVHRHGGRVWAEAAVDRGAMFYFSLGSNA